MAFYVKSKPWGQSWSLRRSLYDGKGDHLLDFRHRSLDIKNRWLVESPSGQKIANLQHYKELTRLHSNVDMFLESSETTVHMRQADATGSRTFLSSHGATIAQIDKQSRCAPENAMPAVAVLVDVEMSTGGL